MDNGILLIPTGGTFESEAYPDPGNPPTNVTTLKGDASPLRGVVASLGSDAGEIEVHRWNSGQEATFNKDSKEFTIGDIRALAEIIRNDTKHRCFVLTHGTDHLALNAEILKKELGKTDKTVALVGAMVPLSMHEKHDSDGIAALQFVLSRIGRLKPGVYASGRDSETGIPGFFDPSEVEKDWDKSKAALRYTVGKALGRENKSYDGLKAASGPDR